MASQRDIRRRIAADRNIKQITRAMQFVAASKLKRAQDATLAARPYSQKIDEVLADLAAVLGEDSHPLLAARAEGKRIIVLVTTDAGLAGPLNTNTIRFVARDIADYQGELAVVTVGRKGRDAMRRNRVPLEAHFDGFGDRPSFADVVPLARLITDGFLGGAFGRVDIVYSHFVSTLTQRPTLDPLLPIKPNEDTDRHPRQPVHLRAEPGRRPRAARSPLRGDPPVPGGPREQGERAVEQDDRDEERHR